MKPTRSGHSRVHERSLAMHRLIARKVLADPTLLDGARDNVRRWQADEGSPRQALIGWEAILRRPVCEVALFLPEQSERAARLRQSSPFAGILTEPERRTVYESFATSAMLRTVG